MVGRSLSIVDGYTVGHWIEDELRGELGTIGSFVPARYSSYLRILHPVESVTGERVTWECVADQVGGIVHPLVQWHSLVKSADPDDSSESSYPGGQPRRGQLPVDILAELARCLSARSSGSEAQFFGFWTGWAWAAGLGRSTTVLHERDSNVIAPVETGRCAFASADYSLPLLTLGDRDFRVFEGSGGLVDCFESGENRAIGRHSPNLMWPEDRSWMMVTEIDFDSTLVGCSKTMASLIESSLDVTTLPVSKSDSLAALRDHLNTRGRRP